MASSPWIVCVCMCMHVCMHICGGDHSNITLGTNNSIFKDTFPQWSLNSVLLLVSRILTKPDLHAHIDYSCSPLWSSLL